MSEIPDRNGNPVDWAPVRAVIFDVDGTLYHQRPVRIRMACRLAGFFLLHPLRIRELLGIRHFRKLRETERYRKASVEEQIRAAAEKAGIRIRSACGKPFRDGCLRSRFPPSPPVRMKKRWPC